jgi:hypothetical protein
MLKDLYKTPVLGTLQGVLVVLILAKKIGVLQTLRLTVQAKSFFIPKDNSKGLPSRNKESK